MRLLGCKSKVKVFKVLKNLFFVKGPLKYNRKKNLKRNNIKFLFTLNLLLLKIKQV